MDTSDSLSLTNEEIQKGIRIFRNKTLGLQFKYNSFHDDPLTSSFNALRFSDIDKWKKHSSSTFSIYFQYPPELNLREDTSSILLGKGSEEIYYSPVAIFITSGPFDDIANDQDFVRREYDKANNCTIVDSTQWDVLGGRQNSDRDSATIIQGHNFKGLRGAPGTDLTRLFLYFPRQQNRNLVILFHEDLETGLSEEYFYKIVESITFYK